MGDRCRARKGVGDDTSLPKGRAESTGDGGHCSRSALSDPHDDVSSALSMKTFGADSNILFGGDRYSASVWCESVSMVVLGDYSGEAAFLKLKWGTNGDFWGNESVIS